MKLAELPDQVSNAIIALVPITTKASMSSQDWEQLYLQSVEDFKKSMIKQNKGRDSFSIVNCGNGAIESRDIFTFDEAINFVTKKRNSVCLMFF